jgi:hypothetical protein
MNINSIQPGTPPRSDFEACFIKDVSAALACDPSRVQIIAVTAGSVVVSFCIGVGGRGEPSPASLKRKLYGLVEDRRSELYDGGVTCMVDEQRSSRALTGDPPFPRMSLSLSLCVLTRSTRSGAHSHVSLPLQGWE